MKKLLLLTFSLVAFASFANGPDFPYDMNEIKAASGYDSDKIHQIHDKNRVRTRDCHGGMTWHVHHHTPYYGPYANGHVWYPNSHSYGHPPAASIGGAIVAGAVVGGAVALCCC